MSLSPLAVATLGLLGERPMHPYEMFQLLLARGEDQLVKVRPGTLYHTVDRLAQDGLLAPVATERAGNRPERTTYEITPAGTEALLDWVRIAMAVPVNEYPRFPVAVSEAHNLPADDAIDLLHRRLAALDGQAAVLSNALDQMSAKGVEERYALDVHYLMAVLAAERDWIERLSGRIQHGDIDWPDTSGTTHPSKGMS